LARFSASLYYRLVPRQLLSRLQIVLVVPVALLFVIPTQAQNSEAKALPSKKAVHAPTKPETPHLEFVTEYLRELAAIEDIRVNAATDENKNDAVSTFSEAIHTGTLMQLELKSQISMLKQMRLNDPFNHLIPGIIEFYQDKIDLWQRLIDISAEFIGGPKANEDYGKLGADIPKIRAKLEYVDQALLKAMPAIFMTLIDQKADSNGHTSHLVITKAERDDLIKQIDADFGAKLDAEHQDFEVSGGSILKAGLQKDFKCSDEPWD
jgi:hypothetical protein